MEAAVAMDFNGLSRRELQALCKLNGVRANMTNLAMAEALQSLPSVDGIDMNGTILCQPTPGKSAMKSVLKAESAIREDQQQHGSPLPRGRRVSVKSPEAIRMDVEDEMKRDPIKDIVRTPGVALRSISRRPRATPAPIPTPAPGTLRRSQRSTARKAAAPIEVELSNTKRSIRRTARSKVAIDLDQEEEAPMASQDDALEVELKGVASNETCADPEEEVAGHLKKGNNSAEAPEQDEDVVSPVEAIVYADRSCVEEMVVVMEDATKPQEDAAIGEEQELVSAENSAPVAVFEDSPILGVLSKVEAVEPAIKNVQDASTGDGNFFGNWSPVSAITDEINLASEDKQFFAVEVPKENDFDSTQKVADAPNKLPTSVLNSKTKEEELNEEKKISGEEIEQTYLSKDDSTEESDLDEESSEESDLYRESSEESDFTEEISEDDIDEEGDMQKVGFTVDAAPEEFDCTFKTDEETDEINSDDAKENDVFEMHETGEINESDESGTSEEEDDFSADLSPEFENAGNFSDVEIESNICPAVLEGIDAAVASSAAKINVKSSDDSVITEEPEVFSLGDNEVSQQAAVTESKMDIVVTSLDQFTITEEKRSDAVGAKEKSPSLRKLKSAVKERLIAAKEKKMCGA